ncbi:hypothetical protein CHH54_03675 [Bacillus sp. 7520-S]|nr:hypothetical protein CHH54_03675 [Bacillus sp. 7520-S]
MRWEYSMEAHMPIWGNQIPYNTGKSKLKVMYIKKQPKWISTIHFFMSIAGTKIPKNTQAYDMYTYISTIQPGIEKENFDDTPYLIPFPVSGSDRAIIIVPGGAFTYKSIEAEGRGIAEKLNKAGITAFILWYRCNPYRKPVPMLDLQRAIRYVKYHATEYDINPAKVGMMGFSAGGYLVSSHITLTRNNPVSCKGYIPDAVDSIEDSVALSGDIYPCVNFKYNVGLLSILYDDKDLRNQEILTKILHDTDLKKHIQPNDAPQFVCWGTKDRAVKPRIIEEYVKELEINKVPHRALALKDADHGFGDCNAKKNRKYAYWLDEFIEWSHAIFDEIN